MFATQTDKIDYIIRLIAKVFLSFIQQLNRDIVRKSCRRFKIPSYRIAFSFLSLVIKIRTLVNVNYLFILYHNNNRGCPRNAIFLPRSFSHRYLIFFLEQAKLVQSANIERHTHLQIHLRQDGFKQKHTHTHTHIYVYICHHIHKCSSNWSLY